MLPTVTERRLSGHNGTRAEAATPIPELAPTLVSPRDLACEPTMCQRCSFARKKTGFTLGLSDPAKATHGRHTWRVQWSRPSRLRPNHEVQSIRHREPIRTERIAIPELREHLRPDPHARLPRREILAEVV